MKRNKALRLIGIMLLCTLLLSVFSACNSSEPPEEPSEEAEKINYYGTEFTVMQDCAYPRSTLHNAYVENTVYVDYVNDRIKQMEQDLNAVITIKSIGDIYNVSAQTLINSTAAGKVLGDIYFADMAGTVSAMQAGCFEPINSCPDIIDIQNTTLYGSPNMLETMTLNSVPYAVIPNMWPQITAGITYLMIVNNELREVTGLPDYREYVENGEWNWEMFEYVLENGGINEPDHKVYSLNLAPDALATLAILNNGVELIVRDEDGFSTELSSDKTIEALTWAKDCITNYGDIANFSGNAWDTLLIDGKTVMGAASNWTTTNQIAYELDDFAALPFPTGPSAKAYDDWRTVVISHVGVSISIMAQEIEASSVIIKELLQPFPQLPDVEALKAFYAQEVYHDPRDAEWVWKIEQNCINNYTRFGGDAIFSAFGSGLRSKTPNELVEANIDSFLNILEEYMIPNYEFMSSFN